MLQKILFPFVVLFLAAIGAFALVATAPSVENVAPERAIQAVRIMEAEPQSVPLWVRTQGTVAPRTESTLVPEVSGRVVWVSPALVSGGFFEMEEPLLRIEKSDYEAALARAKAAQTRARSEYAHASSELKRIKGLSARNVVSSSQLSNAHRADSVAAASVEEARVSLDQAARDLARTEIMAPFEGRVRSESVDVGQFVSRGAAVATLYATDFAEIRLPVPDHQLAFLQILNLRGDVADSGPRVRLHARFAGREHEWEGRVVRTEGEIDPRSRMVHVVARVEDPYGSKDPTSTKPPLAVGLFVRAEIEGPMAENVIVVPRYAMRDNAHLLVVDAEDRLYTREVEVLRMDRDEVLIRGELAAGERICLSPLQVVVEGMRVNPMPDDHKLALGTGS